MAEDDSVKPLPLPPNYVSIAQLQERWLKEKQRKQQEQEKQEQQTKQEEKRKQEEKNSFSQNQESHQKNHQNQRTQVPVDKYLQKGKNHSANVSCVITKEPKLKKVEITEPVVEESLDGTKKKNGYFGKKNFRVKEEIMAVDSVEKGKSEISEGKNQLNFEDEVKEMGRPVIHRVSNSAPLGTGISPSKDKEVKEVGDVSMVEVVGENKVDREKHVQRSKLVLYKIKNDRRRIVEQSVQESCAEKEVVSAEVKERTNDKVNVRDAFRKYDHLRRDVASVSTVGMAEEEITTVVSVGNGGKELSKGKNLVKSEDKVINEVGSVNMVEVVGENSVDRETSGRRSRVGFKEKKDSRRVVKQSRQENSTEKEVASADVKEKAIEKVSVGGAFRKHGHLRRDVAGNVASVSTIDMAEEKSTTVVGVGNGGKELSKGKNLLKSEGKEINGVGSVCTLEVVGENNIDMETAVQRSKVRFKGKKDSRRMVEQSRQENSTEKEVVSADVKERTNEKVNVRGAFRKYGHLRRDVTGDVEKEVVSDDVEERTNEKVNVRGAFRKHGHLRRDVTGDVATVSTIDMAEEEITTPVNVGSSGKELSKGINQLKDENKEINEVGSVYMVEVVGENKIDMEIPLQRSAFGFRGKQGSRRMMGIKVGEVGDKADSVEQSRQENNAEEVVVSDNVKERTSERVRGGDGYGDKKGDVQLVVSEANMKIECNFGNFSLSNRRYGYGNSSNRGYGDKRRYGNSRRYEPRRMLNRRDSSFVWIKKGESSDGNIAETETQVDSSSQSTSQSQLCSQ